MNNWPTTSLEWILCGLVIAFWIAVFVISERRWQLWSRLLAIWVENLEKFVGKR